MKGFTLIEVLIATALITLIIGALLVPLVNMQKMQQQSKITSDMEQNLQYLLNVMDKEIRTADVQQATDGNTNLEIINQNNIPITYDFDASTDPNTFVKTFDPSGTSEETEYGSTDVFEITDVEFNVQEPSDTEVGRVTISIEAETRVGRAFENSIHVQSTTIPRN